MRRVLRYLKGYELFAILAVIFVLANNVMQLVLPSLMSEIVNEGIQKENISVIYQVGLKMVLASAVGGVTAVLASYFSSRVATNFGAKLRRAVFTKVQDLSQSNIDDIGVSSLITRSTNDIRQVEDLVLTTLRMLVTVPIMLFGGSFMAMRTNKKLSIILFIFLPAIGLITLIVLKKVMPWFSEMQKRTDGLNQIIRERLSGVRVIRAFNKNKHEEKRFKEANFALTQLALKTNRFFSFLYPVAILLLSGMIMFLVWVSSSQINSMDVVTQGAEIQNTVGNLQAFVLYAIMIITAIGVTAAMFVMIPRANISAKRISEVLDIVPLVKDPEMPKRAKEDVKGKVEFQNVSFSYTDANEMILEDVSFTSNAGEITAVIGGTGSGKSTLVNLIPRFYDVTQGKILIDDVDVRDMTQLYLAHKIGYIPQRALLFSGTIADNLRFGKSDASEEEMWRALRIAQAEDFVKELPDQLESYVSQNATNLSGGQKQRISIGRALIRDAEIYIFDDSFSALDFRTDARLRAALRTELTNANIIIVAQRVGTILNADRIIVLDEGKFVGMGTHKELIESNTVYQEIVHSQLTQEELS